MISALIASRRAVFPIQYNQEPILEEEIETMLAAANWAPTHRRTEPWRFKIFHSISSRNALSTFLGDTYKKTIEKYSETKHKKVQVKPLQSACVIAICMQRDPRESVPEWEEIAATAMAVQNMWLTAHSLGIGCYWSSPSLRNYLGELVDLAEGEHCLGFLYMGKYDGELAQGIRTTPISAKVQWI